MGTVLHVDKGKKKLHERERRLGGHSHDKEGSILGPDCSRRY